MQPATVLIGVMTMDKGIVRRKRIRETYNSHPRSRANGTEGVRVIFVQGQPSEKWRDTVMAEAKGAFLFCSRRQTAEGVDDVTWLKKGVRLERKRGGRGIVYGGKNAGSRRERLSRRIWHVVMCRANTQNTATCSSSPSPKT